MNKGVPIYNPEMENWAYLWGRARAIIDRCVAVSGFGGWSNAGQISGGLMVIVYAAGSEFERLMQQHMVCTTDSAGNAQCQSFASPGGQVASTIDETPQPNTGPNPGTSGTKQCEGSCADPSECDMNDNCICASNKGIPLSSTWGTFSCMLVPNAAAAMAAVVQNSNTCRGRCVLDDDGTLEIAVTADTPILNPVAPQLTCPCNCTYVSHACCLTQSRIVWEDPAEKVNTSIQPPNGTVCCDTDTGRWTPGLASNDSSTCHPV